jgi:hypothetical protein
MVLSHRPPERRGRWLTNFCQSGQVNQVEVGGLAAALRADLSSLPVVTVGETISAGDPWPLEIPILIEGTPRLRLQLFEDLPNVEWHQGLDAVNQLQDLVIEATREIWPLCEVHGDVLVPKEYAEGGIGWVCDRGGDISIPLGALAIGC